MAKERVKFVNKYRVQCKYSEYVFMPSDAIARSFFERRYDPMEEIHFVTTDGIECVPTFIGTWDNSGNRYEDDFETLCMRNFNVPFKFIRTMWISRIGEYKLSDYWHYIKLKKYDNGSDF